MNVSEQHLRISRSARVYALGDARTARDLWVVCHGYGQLAGRFIRNFVSIAVPGRLIVAPEGLHRFYLDPPPTPARHRRVGSTWMTREDRETDIADYVAYLDRVVADAQSQAVAPLRVTALGFSQGSATVFRWAVLGATQLHTLLLWAGDIPRDVDMVKARARLARVRVVVVRGLQDTLTSAETTEAQREWLEHQGITVEGREFAGGHELDQSTLGQLATLE